MTLGIIIILLEDFRNLSKKKRGSKPAPSRLVNRDYLFSFFFFLLEALVNLTDLLLSHFNLSLQLVHLLVQLSEQAVASLGGCIQEAQVILVGLQLVDQVLIIAHQLLTLTIDGL